MKRIALIVALFVGIVVTASAQSSSLPNASVFWNEINGDTQNGIVVGLTQGVLASAEAAATWGTKSDSTMLMTYFHTAVALGPNGLRREITLYYADPTNSYHSLGIAFMWAVITVYNQTHPRAVAPKVGTN